MKKLWKIVVFYLGICNPFIRTFRIVEQGTRFTLYEYSRFRKIIVDYFYTLEGAKKCRADTIIKNKRKIHWE